MNQFKRAQVVMLPHNNINTKITLYKTASRKPLNLSTNTDILSHHTNQHLYITSDDEIKEDDWIMWNNQIEQAKRVESQMAYHGFKKIIATTDTSLTWIEHDDSVPYPKGTQYRLPQPSQQFILKYIEEYNKGNIITDVLVEYSPSSVTLQTYSNQQINDNLKALSLKVNPKDNTITIKKLKDSWGREEVRKLLNESYLIGMYNANEDEEPIDHDEWMDKNL